MGDVSKGRMGDWNTDAREELIRFPAHLSFSILRARQYPHPLKVSENLSDDAPLLRVSLAHTENSILPEDPPI
jgi:hypothetical protein